MMHTGFRNIMLYAVVCMLGTASLPAQTFEITPFGGYMFGGKISVREGDIDILGNVAFGGVLAIPVKYGIDIEFLYLQQPTSMEFTSRQTGTAEPLFDVGVRYYQVGGLYEVQEGWSVPFFTFTVGASQYTAAPSELTDEWRFAFTVGGGAKLYLSEHFGVRLQGRLLFPLQWSGGSFFCGASDCDGNVSSTTSIVQADLSAGLIIRIGEGRPGVR